MVCYFFNVVTVEIIEQPQLIASIIELQNVSSTKVGYINNKHYLIFLLNQIEISFIIMYSFYLYKRSINV